MSQYTGYIFENGIIDQSFEDYKIRRLNQTTIDAMNETNLNSYDTVEQLFEELDNG